MSLRRHSQSDINWGTSKFYWMCKAVHLCLDCYIYSMSCIATQSIYYELYLGRGTDTWDILQSCKLKQSLLSSFLGTRIEVSKWLWEIIIVEDIIFTTLNRPFFVHLSSQKCLFIRWSFIKFTAWHGNCASRNDGSFLVQEVHLLLAIIYIFNNVPSIVWLL